MAYVKRGVKHQKGVVQRFVLPVGHVKNARLAGANDRNICKTHRISLRIQMALSGMSNPYRYPCYRRRYYDSNKHYVQITRFFKEKMR